MAYKCKYLLVMYSLLLLYFQTFADMVMFIIIITTTTQYVVYCHLINPKCITYYYFPGWHRDGYLVELPVEGTTTCFPAL